MECYCRQTEHQPKTAGLATLDYWGRKYPERKENVIKLPEKGYSLFQLKPDFIQFLLISDADLSNDIRHGRRYEAWFGGTDEKPFLVKLENNDWKNVWDKGSFFDVITPRNIKKYVAAFGSDKLKRQGDIFAYPLPVQKKKEITAVYPDNIHTANSWWSAPRKNIKEGWSLFNTRHHLVDGEIQIYSDHQKGSLIAKGVITAPDHDSLILNEYHILYQTEKLYDPQTAD